MIDLVVTINSVKKSSKLELSSGDRRPLKIWVFRIMEFDAVLTSAELSCVVGEVMRVNVNYTMSGDFVSKSL